MPASLPAPWLVPSFPEPLEASRQEAVCLCRHPLRIDCDDYIMHRVFMIVFSFFVVITFLVN